MDWLTSLIDGLGTAISGAFENLWNSVSGSIWDVFLKWIFEAIYGAIADFFTMIGGMGTDLFTLSWVKSFLKLFSLFGWSLFAAGLVVAVFDTAIEYQSILMRDLVSQFADEQTVGGNIIQIASNALSLLQQTPNLLNLLFMIALGYCVVKIFFDNIKRGGILITQIAVGSLYMFSIPKGYTDGFISWCKQVIALCMTAFLQVTLLFLGLLTWQNNILLGLGVMLAANEVPRIAQNFGLDTSTKVNIMSAVHTTTTAVNLTKAIAKG